MQVCAVGKWNTLFRVLLFCETLMYYLTTLSLVVGIMLTDTKGVIVKLFENFVIYFEALDGSICNVCSFPKTDCFN